ncbi:hypothetical protein QC763_308770 [Podospora pseudopauciseta]|uniref:Uncharacterized protein n=1 Tax=Podospora pseudopauciseta TaxID=2093780 RepID=A0ABR0HHN9_9PEZI|nr:hypothetical protein QC763_308770 [Podospora pseudopauciseta]
MTRPQTTHMDDNHNEHRLLDHERPPPVSEGASLVNNEKSKTGQPEKPWTPGFGPRFPWIASLSILFSFILVGLMISITVRADDTKVDSWAVSPPVLLAIFSTVANALIQVALVRGAAITWWYLAMRPARQSFVQDIHWRWAAAGGIVDAVESILRRGLSKTAVACSFATIVAINAPLLQRAVGVRTREDFRAGVQIGPVYAAPRLPQGFGAVALGRYKELSPAKNFSEVMGEYFSRSPMMIQSDRVNITGEYTTEITAVGYRFDCTAENTTRLPSYSEVDEGYQYYTGLGANVFVSSPVYSEKPKDLWNAKFVATLLKNLLREVDTRKDGRQFFYDAVWKPEQGCIDATHGIEVRSRNCDIYPAVVKYPITISNNTIKLRPSPSPLNDELVSLETFDEAMEDTNRASSTHGGLALLLNHRFSANYTIRPVTPMQDNHRWDALSEGYFAYEMAATAADEVNCNRRFKDPGPIIYEAVRELALRSALRAVNTSDPEHKLMLEGEQTETVAVFVANMAFLYGAVAVTVLATVAVMPLYYGFWKLGREVSMSPLEVAKAFRAVQLEGVASNAEIGGLLKGVGGRPIRYGVVEVEEGGWVLGMGKPGRTVHPDEMGERDSLEGDGESVRGREER